MQEDLATLFEQGTPIEQDMPIQKTPNVSKNVSSNNEDLATLFEQGTPIEQNKPISDFDSIVTPEQPQQEIDPIDQHRPLDVDDETWNDVKSRVPKFLDTKASNPIMKSLLKDVGLTEDFKKIEEPSIIKNTAEAYKLKALNENIEMEYGDLKKLYDASVNGDKEAQDYLSEKQKTLNNEVVKALRIKGIEAFYDKGELWVAGIDEDGNEIAKSLDESTIKSIIAGFGASSGEMGGGISGAMAGASAGFKAGGFDPRKKLLGATVGGLAGGYAGSAIGKYADLLRATTELNKKLSAREYIEKSTAAGVADTIGAMGVGVVAKGVSKAVEPLEKLSQRAWTLYKSGNIQGAVKVVKDDYGLTDADIDTLFKNVSKDVEGLDELQGDDLLRAKLLAVVQQQDQGEGLIAEAIKKTPKGAMETSKEIATRAKEVLKYAESMGSKPSAIKKSVQSYEKAVGENYGEVRGLIDEALPNYKPDLDLASFSGTLKELNTRVIDPTVKEKITNLAESLSSQKVETVGDLIETRQLFNRFYGKNQSHFESKVDKETLMSIQKSIDSKIDEAMGTLPDEVSTGLKNAFTDAKKQYEEMFKTRDTATYISIFGKKGKGKGKTEAEIGRSLVKYSQSVDNDLEVVLSKLSPVQRVKSEFSIINELLSTSMGNTQAKSIDFNKLLEGINASKNTFKSDEAKQFIKNVEEFDKKFGKDVGLQKATEGVVAKEMNSIATSVIGKTKMLLASIQFKAIQRLAISDEGRRLSLQKSLEMALQKSRTPREFFFEASKIKGMPNADREALKKAVKDIGVQEAKLKEQATIQATKNEEAIAKAKVEKEARVAKVEAEAKQRWEAAIAEKAQEMKNRKANSQAQRAKDAAVVPIGGSEDEAKQAVKNVFAKNKSEESRIKNMSKADIEELDRLYAEEAKYKNMSKADKEELFRLDASESSQAFAKGVPELLGGTIAGVEQDEQGNITIDPEKFLMGVLGVSSIRGLNKAYKNSPKTQDKVEKALRSLAKDSTRVAGDMIEKINKQIGLNIEPNIVPAIKGSPNYKAISKTSLIKNDDGTPKIMYHQTSEDAAKLIKEGEFDISKGKARMSDDSVPDGIFFKPTEKDIGVGGKVQIPVYLDIKNPLIVKNREEIKSIINKVSSDYKNLGKQQELIDEKYSKILDVAENKYDKLAKESYDYKKMEYRKEAKGVMDKVSKEMDKILEEWGDAQKNIPTKSREIINKYLKDNNYDGMIIKEDKGSLGRSTETIIALDPKQVYGATKEFSKGAIK